MKKINIILGDTDTTLSQKTLNPNHVKVLNTLFTVDKIFTGKIEFVQASDEGFLDVFEYESNIARQKSAKQPDTTDKPDLEDEESATQEKQVAKGLKILTPNQMLSRLPISLAQLKAGNNSDELNNETRQLLYSLYRSKKFTKQLYKSLTDII